jgi:hypothetical protein
VSRLLVAVGGSGQHVALTVARLLYLRALRDVGCCVVDSDRTSPLSKALITFNDLVSPELGFHHPLRGAENFLVPFETQNAQADRGATGLPFRALFNLERGSTSEGVFDALFPREDAGFNVQEGFYARPILGASTFGAFGEVDNGVAKTIQARANNAQQAFIAGSFIGGTGAGVIPSLVQQVTHGSTTQWFGAFHLLWLQPPDVGSKGKTSRAEMDANMRHGLEYYYRAIAPKLASSVIIGPPKTPAPLAQECSPVDGEIHSIFHVVAARAMFHFSSSATIANMHAVHCYNHDDNAPKALLDAEWAGGVTLRDRLLIARRAARSLDYYLATDAQGAVSALKKAFGMFGGDAGNVPAGLKTDILAFADKAGRGRSTFGAGGIPEFVDDLLGDLRHRQRALTECISAFEKVFGALPSDSRFDVAESGAGGPLDTLKALWRSPTPIPTLSDKTPASEYHHRLAQALESRLLDAQFKN